MLSKGRRGSSGLYRFFISSFCPLFLSIHVTYQRHPTSVSGKTEVAGWSCTGNRTTRFIIDFFIRIRCADNWLFQDFSEAVKRSSLVNRTNQYSGRIIKCLLLHGICIRLTASGISLGLRNDPSGSLSNSAIPLHPRIFRQEYPSYALPTYRHVPEQSSKP